jgi:hypothetical protein
LIFTNIVRVRCVPESPIVIIVAPPTYFTKIRSTTNAVISIDPVFFIIYGDPVKIVVKRIVLRNIVMK